MKKQSVLVALLACVVISTQAFVQMAWAAVPIEESVEESAGRISPQSQPVQQAQGDLGIPPTIEPTTPGANQPRPVSNAPRVQANSGSGQLSDLFYQLQVLQQELQDLRGQVEDQGHLINRLQRDQKEQYRDLDRRVATTSDGGSSPGLSARSPNTSSNTANAGASSSAGSVSEREVYTSAFDAMRARKFDESLRGFEGLIENYPNGQFTANAFYWIGELHLVANSDAEQARQSFMQVVNLYPDHQKAPDAMYKLGVVYHNLGDIPTALNYLQRAQSEYPDSSASGLAAKYAAELQ